LYCGESIELWPLTGEGGFTTLTADQVANLATALANETAPVADLCP